MRSPVFFFTILEIFFDIWRFQETAKNGRQLLVKYKRLLHKTQGTFLIVISYILLYSDINRLSQTGLIEYIRAKCTISNSLIDLANLINLAKFKLTKSEISPTLVQLGNFHDLLMQDKAVPLKFCNFQCLTSHLPLFTNNRIGLGHLIPVILFQLEELSKEFFSRILGNFDISSIFCDFKLILS